MRDWFKEHPEAATPGAHEALKAAAEFQFSKAAEALAAQQEEIDAQVDAWTNDLIRDKDIGGRKAKASIEGAVAGMKDIAGDGFAGLNEILTATGLRQHPAIVKAFLHWSKTHSQDRTEAGAPARGPSSTSRAARAYSNSMSS